MYDYAALEKDFRRYERYAKTGVIGRTVCGRPIPYVFLGEMGAKQLLVQGAIHAREHITAAFLSMLVDGYLSSSRPVGFGLWVVPMVNADGVELAGHGLDTVPAKLREGLTAMNGGSGDFSLWKANARGVDLNNNFPARWGRGDYQVQCPGPHGYIGERPFSEPECKALARFTCQVKPRATLSYHCKGEVIYWDFHEEGAQRKRDRAIARQLSAATGYPLEETGGSTGGYKDWCIEWLKIPAFTVEVGRDELAHPLPYTELNDIYRRNKGAVEVLKGLI